MAWRLNLMILLLCSSAKVSSQQGFLDAFNADKELQSASIAVEVVNLSRDSMLLSHRADLGVAPASIMKMATTAAALERLGSGFRFRSRLGIRGTLNNGTLAGDLVLASDGDPTLGSQHLNTPDFEQLLQLWGEAAGRLGIQVIEGDVIVDASYYGRAGTPGSWQYQDLGNYYGSGCHSLNINDNLYVVEFQQAPSPGQMTGVISVQPEVPSLEVMNEVVSGAKGSGDQAYIYGAPYQSGITIRGTIPPGRGSFEIKGSIPNPPLFAAHHLRKALTSAGISCQGNIGVTYSSVEDVVTIWEQESVPLIEITDATNRSSINLFAEALGKKMEALDSMFTLEDHWSELGLDMAGVAFSDYSGLSKNNVVTATFMSQLLGYIYSQDGLFRQIKNGLSVAGESGTMRSMLRSSPARGKIWGKSGLISGVRCYIGYMQLPNADWLSFALLAQNYSCSSGAMRNKFAALLDALYRSQQ